MADLAKYVVSLEAQAARYVRELDRAQRRLDQFERNQGTVAARIQRQFEAMALRAGTALLGIFSVRELGRASDTMRTIENRLRLVTSSAEELAFVQDRLLQIANKTNNAYLSTVELYSRVARSAAQLNLTQRELLELTEGINNAVLVSGATAQEAAAGLVQFAQGLASGALRGDELRSVLEQMPRLAQAIAEGMGVTVGELRVLGQQGQLTSQQVIRAIQSQLATLRDEAARTEPTISQALTKLGNSFSSLVGRIDQATNASKLLREAIESLASMLQNIGVEHAPDITEIGVRIAAQEVEVLELTKRLEEARRRLEDEAGGRVQVRAGLLRFEVGRLEAELGAAEARLEELRVQLRQATEDLERPVTVSAQDQYVADLIAALKPTTEDVQFLNDVVAQLALERQREAEELRLYIDEFVADLNAPRLSRGQELSPELRQFIADLEEAEQLTESLRTEAERNAEAWRRAQELFAGGFIDDETLKRARDQFDNMASDLEAIGKSAGRGLKDALVDAMTGIEVRWDDMLRRMIANAALDQLFALLGTLGGPVGHVARFLGFGGARAEGGPVFPGKAFLVGEKGPELFVPGATGRIIPNASGTTINVDARGAHDPVAVEQAVERGVRAAVQISGAQTQSMISRMFRPSMA